MLAKNGGTIIHPAPNNLGKFCPAALSSSALTVMGHLNLQYHLPRERLELRCPYRKSNPHVSMVQPSKNGPPLDAPGALNEPSNRRILAQR